MLKVYNPSSAYESENEITRFYVAYHDPEKLNACIAPPGAVKLHLGSLNIPSPWQINAIAESRALLAMALNPDDSLPETGYVALFHASYDAKFAGLPKLSDLPEAAKSALSPDSVFSPLVSLDFLHQAEAVHPGLGLVLRRIARRCGVKLLPRPAPMTNSFIAHHSVWRRFLPDWLRLFIASVDECNVIKFDASRCKQGLIPAYILERLTTLWFASQEDLKVASIVCPGVGPNGEISCYVPEMDNGESRGIWIGTNDPDIHSLLIEGEVQGIWNSAECKYYSLINGSYVCTGPPPATPPKANPYFDGIFGKQPGGSLRYDDWKPAQVNQPSNDHITILPPA